MWRTGGHWRRCLHGLLAGLVFVAALIGIAHHHDDATSDVARCAVCIAGAHSPAISQPRTVVGPGTHLIARVPERLVAAPACGGVVRLQGRGPPLVADLQLS